MPPRGRPAVVQHLTPADLSARWAGMSLETLRDWRRYGRGPAYIRGDGDGDKATILYPLADVEAWEQSHRVDPAARATA